MLGYLTLSRILNWALGICRTLHGFLLKTELMVAGPYQTVWFSLLQVSEVIAAVIRASIVAFHNAIYILQDPTTPWYLLNKRSHRQIMDNSLEECPSTPMVCCLHSLHLITCGVLRLRQLWRHPTWGIWVWDINLRGYGILQVSLSWSLGTDECGLVMDIMLVTRAELWQKQENDFLHFVERCRIVGPLYIIHNCGDPHNAYS